MPIPSSLTSLIDVITPIFLQNSPSQNCTHTVMKTFTKVDHPLMTIFTQPDVELGILSVSPIAIGSLPFISLQLMMSHLMGGTSWCQLISIHIFGPIIITTTSSPNCQHGPCLAIGRSLLRIPMLHHIMTLMNPPALQW